MKNHTNIVDIDKYVSYQNDGIVSRELISKEEGGITFFAFDKGQRLSEHTAPFDAIVQIIDGKANIIIDGKDHFLDAGETIIMPANISHAVQAIEKFKMVLTMIRV